MHLQTLTGMKHRCVNAIMDYLKTGIPEKDFDISSRIHSDTGTITIRSRGIDMNALFFV